MARQAVKPPQEIADAHALVAQRYAGYFVGYPYRNPQMQKVDPAVDVDRRRPWKEPNIVADDCVFCVRLTDEDAERRVAGIQYAIDIEATRSKSAHYIGWLASGSPDVLEPNGGGSRSHEAHLANRRRFCELFQDMPTERRPDGWRLRPLPLVTLPLRLKRKVCIEWNHVYLPWMKDAGLEYDFDKRVFYREVADSGADESDPFIEVMEVGDQQYVYMGLMGPV
jgi:hypothetical protein